jgi:hypothetical protein
MVSVWMNQPATDVPSCATMSTSQKPGGGLFHFATIEGWSRVKFRRPIDILKIGTVLVRDYQGRRLTATVESRRSGGRLLAPLGVAPRFFALKSCAEQSAVRDRRAARHHRQSQPSIGRASLAPVIQCEPTD